MKSEGGRGKNPNGPKGRKDGGRRKKWATRWHSKGGRRKSTKKTTPLWKKAAEKGRGQEENPEKTPHIG